MDAEDVVVDEAVKPGRKARWAALLIVPVALSAACGNTTGAADVVDPDSNPTLPRSSICDMFATQSTALENTTQTSLCRPEAVDGERCSPMPGGAPLGICVSVTRLSGGYYAPYERAHRVPKICSYMGGDRCGAFGTPDHMGCGVVAQCLPLPPSDGGQRYTCVPYHCD